MIAARRRHRCRRTVTVHQRNLPLLLALLFSAAPMSGAMAGETDGKLHVPDEFPTIQEAIEAAEARADPPHEVIIEPGVYHEAIDLLGKQIIVRSVDPVDPGVIATTVIDATGLSNSVVKCRGGETPTTTLFGLTFTGGTGSPDSSGEITGGGLHIFQSSPTVTDCRFIANTAVEDGGGVYVDGGAPLFESCHFINNSASDDGGAMAVRGGGAVTLFTCIFGGNSAVEDGGAIRVRSGSVELVSCSFKSNTAADAGAFFAHASDAVVSIELSKFCGNEPNDVVGPFIDLDNDFLGGCDADRDGDGLPDIWELEGIDGNDDYVPDFLLDGADVMHKDLYVEVDSMPGFAMSDETRASLSFVFATAPVANPDGEQGISLHVLRDEATIPHEPVWQTTGGCWPDDFDLTKALFFGTEDERNADNADAILAAKARAFRYCIIAHEASGDFGGCGEWPGNDFVIFNGPVTDDSVTAAAKFMHELGHNLGLGHGGPDDEINYKPNYVSIMNYSFNYRYGWNRTFWKLDFSRRQLDAIEELAIDETAGIGADDGFYDLVRSPYGVNILDGFGDPVREMRYVRLHNEPEDFGEPAGTLFPDGAFDTSVVQDLNFLGPAVPRANEPSLGETMLGHDDWSNLQYAIPEDADSAGATFPEELTHAEIQWINDNFPVPTCLPDFDSDDGVGFADLLELLYAWDTDSQTHDLDGSGAVGFADLLDLLNQWGPCE